MRVLVTGGTGQLGTAVLRRLATDRGITCLSGLCRRPAPRRAPYAAVRWHLADLAEASSEPVLAQAMSTVDAVVHLAWQARPARDAERAWRTNVVGTRRVVEAAAAAGVGHLVYASSVGAYSRRGGAAPVDESWPARGIPTSRFSREKAAVEAWLDLREGELGLPVARIRPALTYPPYLLRLPGGTGQPVLPLPAGITVQAVHAEDLAGAVAAALRWRAIGPFNLAAEPLSDRQVATLTGARRLPPALLRAGLAAAYHARLAGTAPGWLDLAMGVPVLDASRARRELGWRPYRGTGEALAAAGWVFSRA